MQLIARAVFFTLLMPGVVTVVVPCYILGGPAALRMPVFSFPGVIVAAFGLFASGVLLYCIWAFAFYGEGTLAPVSPAKALVVRGPYRRTRNPMYLAVVCVLLSEALLFERPELTIYAALVFVFFHLFVLLYEEPHLKGQFGEEYRRYCETVPRWGISSRPFLGKNEAAPRNEFS